MEEIVEFVCHTSIDYLLHDFSLILTEREDIPGRFPGSDPLRASKLLGTKLVRERDSEREKMRVRSPRNPGQENRREFAPVKAGAGWPGKRSIRW